MAFEPVQVMSNSDGVQSFLFNSALAWNAEQRRLLPIDSDGYPSLPNASAAVAPVARARAVPGAPGGVAESHNPLNLRCLAGNAIG